MQAPVDSAQGLQGVDCMNIFDSPCLAPMSIANTLIIWTKFVNSLDKVIQYNNSQFLFENSVTSLLHILHLFGFQKYHDIHAKNYAIIFRFIKVM